MTKILLAEDNHVNQIVATQMLEKIGYEVECANNGLEAVEMVSKRDFDVIIMDCQMPEMDGYQATAKLKSMSASGEIKTTPIIAFTAHAMEGDKEKCLAAGMDDYISKPVDEHQLKEIVERWIDTSVSTESEASSEVQDKASADGYIDAESFGNLKQIMGDSFDALLDAFKESVLKLIEEMGEAIGKHDFASLSKLAHTIKSPAAQLGAKKLSDAALDLETDATKNSLDENAEAVLKIQDLYNATVKEMESSSF